MNKELLFSVTADDCEWSTMTAGGPGGQHQNRSQTAVRVVHPPSGAVGVSREHRSQIQNKRTAFRRMAQTKEFRRWVRLEAARRSGEPSIEAQVDAWMRPEHLKIEVHDGQRWTTKTDV